MWKKLNGLFRQFLHREERFHRVLKQESHRRSMPLFETVLVRYEEDCTGELGNSTEWTNSVARFIMTGRVYQLLAGAGYLAARQKHEQSNLAGLSTEGEEGIAEIDKVLGELGLEREPRIRTIGDLPKYIKLPLLNVLIIEGFNENSPLELLTLLSREKISVILGEKKTKSLEQILGKENLHLGTSIPEEPSSKVELSKVNVIPEADVYSTLIQEAIDSLRKFLILRNKEKQALIINFFQSVRREIRQLNPLSEEETIKEANSDLEEDTSTMQEAKLEYEKWKFVKGEGAVVKDTGQVVDIKRDFLDRLNNLTNKITGGLQTVAVDISSEPNKVLAERLNRAAKYIRTLELFLRALNICYPGQPGLGPGTWAEIVEPPSVRQKLSTRAEAREPAVMKQRLEEALKQDYRVIALDFDGTIYTTEMPKEEFEEMVEVLVDILKLGKYIAIVTSGSPEYVEELLITKLRSHPRITQDELNRLDVYHSGGAAGYNVGRGQIHYQFPFSDSLRQEVTRFFSGNP